MSFSNNPQEIWSKAKEISLSRDHPHKVWTELRKWSIEAGNPLALRAAVIEFLSAHGTNPEAATLLPEVMRNATMISPSLPLEDRKRLIDLADRTSAAFKSSFKSAELPTKPNKAPERIEPIVSIPIKDKEKVDIFTPLKPTTETSQLIRARETMLRINDRMTNFRFRTNTTLEGKSTILGLNQGIANSPIGITAPHELQSFSMPVETPRKIGPPPKKESEGNKLLKKLIKRVKSHAADATPKPTKRNARKKKSRKKR